MKPNLIVLFGAILTSTTLAQKDDRRPAATSPPKTTAKANVLCQDLECPGVSFQDSGTRYCWNLDSGTIGQCLRRDTDFRPYVSKSLDLDFPCHGQNFRFEIDSKTYLFNGTEVIDLTSGGKPADLGNVRRLLNQKASDDDDLGSGQFYCWRSVKGSKIAFFYDDGVFFSLATDANGRLVQTRRGGWARTTKSAPANRPLKESDYEETTTEKPSTRREKEVPTSKTRPVEVTSAKPEKETKFTRPPTTSTTTQPPKPSTNCETDSKTLAELVDGAFELGRGAKTAVARRLANIAQEALPKTCLLANGNKDCGGDEFVCQGLPENFAISCKMGFCRMAKFDELCNATQTKVKAPSGNPCVANDDCLTQSCIDKTCRCPKGKRLQASIDFSFQLNTVQYLETCLDRTAASTSTPGKPGDVCREAASLVSSKTAASSSTDGRCSLNSICGKCPEQMANPWAPSTCIRVRSDDREGATKAAKAGKDDCSCGYLARCSRFGDVTACQCPAGYELEANLQDCFGWNVTEVGQCSKTCGNDGVQTVKRSCDKSPNSTVTCEGSAVVERPCRGAVACPVAADVAASSVEIKIESEILTVDIFDQVLADDLRSKLTLTLNKNCTATAEMFEKCCQGRSWHGAKNFSDLSLDCIDPENGIDFMNKFSNGSFFSFFMMVKGNLSSQCCLAGTDTKTKSRVKRAATAGALDQATLAALMMDQSMVAEMSSTFSTVDPFASFTTSSIALASTGSGTGTGSSAGTGTSGGSGQVANEMTTNGVASIATEPQTTPAFLDFDNGFPVWGAGVFGAGLAIAIIGGVTGTVVCIYKKKTAKFRKISSAIPNREELGNRRKFVTDYEENYRPIQQDEAYPSYYTKYPPSGKSRALAPRSAHEVTPREVTSVKASATGPRSISAVVEEIENNNGDNSPTGDGLSREKSAISNFSKFSAH